jgi:hypothetical protein
MNRKLKSRRGVHSGRKRKQGKVKGEYQLFHLLPTFLYFYYLYDKNLHINKLILKIYPLNISFL